VKGLKNVETRIIETAQRIKGLRELLEISQEEMAASLGMSQKRYCEYESGERDFSFTFLYNCADKLGVDIVELLTGEVPKLSHYGIVRKGEGLNIKRREGFKYQHLCYRFRDKQAEAFLVTAPYNHEEQDKPIHMSRHEGQEFDYIISGSLKCMFENHEEILNEGDSVYYDSGRGHGMIATGGQDCTLIAVTIHPPKHNND